MIENSPRPRSVSPTLNAVAPERSALLPANCPATTTPNSDTDTNANHQVNNFKDYERCYNRESNGDADSNQLVVLRGEETRSLELGKWPTNSAADTNREHSWRGR